MDDTGYYYKYSKLLAAPEIKGPMQWSLLAVRVYPRTQLSDTAQTHKFTAHRHITMLCYHALGWHVEEVYSWTC